MSQLRYLNLGCGRVILPAPKPAHYMLLPDGLTEYALWHNVDRNAQPGVDEVVDVFRYPFPWADNSFDGALCSHLCEHIPHEIRMSERIEQADAGMEFYRKQRDMLMPTTSRDDPIRRHETYGWSYEHSRANDLARLQDGWWAFFGELHRVLTPGAIVHILSPYATTTGGMVDPSHTRYLMPASFMHSMAPDPNSPFQYANGGCHFEIPEPWVFSVHQDYGHLTQPGHEQELAHTIEHSFNAVVDFYLKLRVVK